MNRSSWKFQPALLKGSKVYDTVVKILNISAGFHAGRDPDHTGTDDLVTGWLLSISDGISTYAVKDNNQHGNIVDGLIAGLQKYREEMIQCGVITTK